MQPNGPLLKKSDSILSLLDEDVPGERSGFRGVTQRRGDISPRGTARNMVLRALVSNHLSCDDKTWFGRGGLVHHWVQ